MIYIMLWTLTMALWIFYSIFAIIFGTENDTESQWLFNYIIKIIMTVFIMLHTSMFYMSYRRIVILRQTLTHSENKVVLR